MPLIPTSPLERIVRHRRSLGLPCHLPFFRAHLVVWGAIHLGLYATVAGTAFVAAQAAIRLAGW